MRAADVAEIVGQFRRGLLVHEAHAIRNAEVGDARDRNHRARAGRRKAILQLPAIRHLPAQFVHHANDSPYNNGTIGGLNLVSQSYNFVDRSHVGGVQLVSVINDHIVNELRGQVAYRGQLQNSFSASGAGPVITVAGIAHFGGPNGAGFVYQETTPELADNFSYIRGAHSF